MCITHSEYLSVTLFIQHAKHMCRILLSYVAFLVSPYFSTLYRKRHDFRKKKVIEYKMCFCFSLKNFI
jgi:hypothetical protein